MDDNTERRLSALETSVSKIENQVSAMAATIPHLAKESQVSAIAATIPHLATKSDVTGIEVTMIKWFIATALALTGAVFTITKFVH